MFTFVDLLAEQNAAAVTKLSNVSVTFEGRLIPANHIKSLLASGGAS